MELKRETATGLTDRVIQFGEGNFLRGFVDWLFDKLNKEMDFGAGVTLVQPLEMGLVDKIMEQDGLYTLILRGLQNGEKVYDTTKVECITKGINPYSDWEGFLNLASVPTYRFIVSNTTEAGIEYKEEDAANAPNLSYPGKLTLLLKKRFDLGLDGFILIPCELIDYNGDNLKKCIIKYAESWNLGADFIKWIEEENYFTNTLVDRIVTGYPRDEAAEIEAQLGYKDAVLDTAEIFHLWVIEGDKKLSEELPFHKIGLNVIWTDDVTPYKARKVRILNGAHTMMVLAAHLAGLETVKEAMDDKLVSSYMMQGLYDEIIPTLTLPKEELMAFASAVLERFSNPYIKHYLLSIALNSVSKFKVRVLPSLLGYMKLKNEIPNTLAFSLAALIAFYRTDKSNDDAEIMEYMKTASVADILKRTDYWGEDLTMLYDVVNGHYEKIMTIGVREAMKEVVK